MKTVWLLDVDGVINATRAGWSSQPYSGYAYYLGREYRMRWSPTLISRMRYLIDTQPSLRIVWATSWCGDTDQLEKLFKLPALSSAALTRMEGSHKYKTALDVVNSGQRLIWTDDEFVPEFGPWYDELTKYNSSLLIKPKPSRGLRPEHLDDIERFLS